MGKILSILIGLVLMALGIWGVVAWKVEVLAFLQAAVALMAILVGLGIFVFGLSELRAGAEELPVVETPAAPEEPQESSEPSESAEDKS